MADARAIIRISALPDSALKRALDGTVDAARKASRGVAVEQARAAKEAQRAQAKSAHMAERASGQAAAEAIRHARRVEFETKRSTERMLRDAERAASRERREAEKTARAKIHAAERAAVGEQREAEKSARARVRAAERAAATERREYQKTARTQIREAERALKAQTKAAQQAAEKRRALGMAIVGGAYGAAKGAGALAARGQGLAGVASLEDRLNTAGEFRSNLIRTAGEAGLSPEERAKVETNLLKVSEQTNVSITDLVDGLKTAQTRFDQFREFNAIIGDLAKVSQATGEPLEDMIGAIGTMSKAYQLDEAGQREIVNAMIAMAERGAISPGDFARSMASKAGTFQMATGRTGVGAAREFMATAQVLGTSQAGADESATMLERFMQRIALPDTQAKLAQIGVQTTDKSGKLLQVSEIGRQLSENKAFQKAGVRQAVFPQIEAMNAAQFIMAELGRNPDAFKSLQDINAAEGQSSVDRRFGQLSSDPMFKLRNVGVRAQTETVRDADRIVQAITPAVTELTALQTKFPLLSESLDTLESAVRWAVGTLLADRFIRGAGSFGTTAGEALGKTASVSLGQSFSSTSTLGKVGMLGQVMGTGLAAYFATHEFLKMTGIDKSIEKLGEKVFNLLHPQGSPSFSSGSIVRDASLTTSAQDAAAAKQAAEDAITNFLSPGGQGGSVLPSPLIPPANAELKITIKGPGEVTSVTNSGLYIETTADNGRRDIFPP